jgi:hypothetical protein
MAILLCTSAAKASLDAYLGTNAVRSSLHNRGLYYVEDTYMQHLLLGGTIERCQLHC